MLKREFRKFPETIKKGDVITFPDADDEYIVTKTPSETKLLCCEVKDKRTGKRYSQFAFKGILINSKELN